jgi:hypothetical protein
MKQKGVSLGATPPMGETLVSLQMTGLSGVQRRIMEHNKTVFNNKTDKSEFINLHQYQIEQSRNMSEPVVQWSATKENERITGANKSQTVDEGWGLRGNLGFPTDDQILLSATKENKKMKEIHNKVTSNPAGKIPSDWTNMADYFYEKGISAIDIMMYLKSREDEYPHNSISSIELEFHKIKGNYKNEKLLMFRMLWFIHKLHLHII